MRSSSLFFGICLVSLTWLAHPSRGFAQNDGKPAAWEVLLQQGKLVEAEGLLAKTLTEQPGDDNARFALGIVQFLHAVETRMQVFHRYGFKTEGNGIIPITNLPILPNPKPDPLDYQTARGLLQGWVDDLAKVEATLAGVKSPDVKLPLHFGLIRLDFDGDGKSTDDETLWNIYNHFNRNANASAEAAKGFVVAVDRGDVDWLRGYCHLLAAFSEAVLTYDFQELFHRSGYLLFNGIKAPEPFLTVNGDAENAMVSRIVDYVAAVHLLRLPVAEPKRMQTTLAHLESVVALSRSSWKFILAETDDDHEWVPNPKQSTIVPETKVTDEMVQGWTEFLDEFSAILAGKKLAPFWRGDNPKLGLNVRRIMTDPRPFDLVLWIQGTALVPYLEEGEVTKPDTWTRFNRIFRGEFIGFAIWFN